MTDTKAVKKNISDMVKMIAQATIDGTAGAASGTVLPAGKSMYDITGGFTGDGGSDQGDSIKANLDLIQADIGDPTAASDTLYAQARHINKFPIDGTTPPVANTLADTLHKDANYTYSKTTDSLEAIRDSADSGYTDVYTNNAQYIAETTVVGAATTGSIGDTVDKLVTSADGASTKFPATVAQDSILAKIMTKANPAIVANVYDNTTDSLEAISDRQQTTGGFGGSTVTKAMTLDGGAGSGAVGTVALFTVTGDVIVRVVAVCETSLEDASTGTISVGIAGSTASILPVTTASDIDATDIWHDTSPDSGIETLSTIREYIVSNGSDIFATVAVDSIDSGKINFYCFWTPLSSTGSVVAA